TLRRLRGLARTTQSPPTQDPPRRGRHPHAVPRVATVDCSVFQRVLTALRTLVSARPRTSTAVVCVSAAPHTADFPGCAGGWRTEECCVDPSGRRKETCRTSKPV